MKIVYSHIRRPVASPTLVDLVASLEYGKQDKVFRRALADLSQIGIPIWPSTRALCQAVTICEIHPEDGEDFKSVAGAAFCCNKDQFNRKIGRLISYGRANNKLLTNKPTVKP